MEQKLTNIGSICAGKRLIPLLYTSHLVGAWWLANVKSSTASVVIQ